MRDRKWLAGCFIGMLLLLTGCAKLEAKPHVHTWENRKCAVCGEEKEVLRLGNWEYVLWGDTGTVEVTAFLEAVTKALCSSPAASQILRRTLSGTVKVSGYMYGTDPTPGSIAWTGG